MFQRIMNAFRRNPGRLALTLAVLLSIVNIVLVATTLLRDQSANRMALEVVELENSLAQLRQAEQEGLQGPGAGGAGRGSRTRDAEELLSAA